MFGKLMKYEMKSLSRSLLPLYLVILVVSVVNRVTIQLDSSSEIANLSQNISLMLYFGLCVAVAAITFIVVIQRFYKGLLGQEGYLMFTLPVSTWQLTFSKLLSAVLLTILSGIVGLLSITILSGVEIGMFFDLIVRVFRYANPDVLLLLFEFLLLCIASVISSIVHIYLAMALGHLANRHRIAMSFVWFMVISTALSFLRGLLVVGVGVSPSLSILLLSAVSYDPLLNIHSLLWSNIFSFLAFSALFYFVTNWILKNKLNLE